MKIKLAHALIGAFLAALFGSQAVANSQIKEDFAYAFGSSAGLDSGSIRLLSPSEMDETEGLFLAWLIRLGPRVIREAIDILKAVRVEFTNARKDGIEYNAWLRIGQSWSKERGFVTDAIRWGSNTRKANQKVKNLVLREFNKRLYKTKIPLNTWRTNDPGHLHLWRTKRKPRSKTPGSGASGSSVSFATANSRDEGPVLSPDLHSGEGGVISSINWETITAEQLLTGKYTNQLLTEAATGPMGTGQTARDWKMEDLTEKQVALGLSILLFVSDPENNVGIDIPWEVTREFFSATIYLRKNPRKKGRAAKLAKLGLKQLEYIIGQHSQDYHPPEDDSEDDASAPATGPDAVVLSAVPGADVLTTDSPAAPETALDRNTYLPVQAHWWMHEYRAR